MAPFRGGSTGTDVNVTTVPLSGYPNGDSITSSSFIVDLVSDNAAQTVLDSITISQSRDFQPETLFVSTLPTNPIPSILYLTPN